MDLRETAWRLARQAGVTRFAEVTGFDRIGIPVMQAVRPQSRSLSVSQGKGRSRWQAGISAAMEALELHLAEKVLPAARRPPDLSEQSLWNRHLPPGARLGGQPIDWIEGQDLLSGRHCALPHGLVSMDFTRPQPMHPISTGLAGHATRERAITTALCEVRDRVGLHRFATMDAFERRSAEIDPASLPSREMQWATRRIAGAGAHLRLWDMFPGQPWPVIVAVLFDSGGPQMTVPSLGVCCRRGQAAAAFGAIAEAAQSRVTLLAGARDDIGFDQFGDAVDRVAGILLRSLSFQPSDHPVSPEVPLADDDSRDALLRLLEVDGAAAITIADLSPSDWPLYFVKALAPGLPDGERQQP